MTHFNNYFKKSFNALFFILSTGTITAQYSIQNIRYETDSCDGSFDLDVKGNTFSNEYTLLSNNTSTEFGVDLDQYDMYSQVQLKYNAIDYFVADQVYVKWGKAIDGVTDEIKDIVVIKNKLSASTRLTTNQNAGKAASTLVVRSQNATLESPISNIQLPKDFNIPINNKWLKVFDSENGDIISGIEKL